MILFQIVWLQDFPLISTPPPSTLAPFGVTFQGTLRTLLSTLNITPGLMSLSVSDLGGVHLPFTSLNDLLTPYDFSKVQVSLVMSIPGKHEGWKHVLTVGHTGLMSAVRHIGAQCPGGKALTLEYQVRYVLSFTHYYLIIQLVQ